jgi:hypothetical protein
LLADVKHEVALAYQISDTKAGDGETLPAVLADAQDNLPEGRIKTLAYDKAADTNDVHALLSEAGIKPVIQNRSLWKEDHERMLPGHDGNSSIVYDESGTVYCYNRASKPMVRQKMAFIGYEPARETLKYRCPAKHEGWECPMSKICNAGKSYGMTVRVPREIDLRRFPALPRATKKFEEKYKGRTAIERLAPAVDSAQFLRIPAPMPIPHRNIYPHSHPQPTFLQRNRLSKTSSLKSPILSFRSQFSPIPGATSCHSGLCRHEQSQDATMSQDSDGPCCRPGMANVGTSPDSGFGKVQLRFPPHVNQRPP